MRTFIYGLIGAGALMFWGCDSKQRLANEISGEWETGLQTLSDPSAAECNIFETYAFMPMADGNAAASGTLIVSGIVQMTFAPQFDGRPVEAVEQGIAAHSSIQGTWHVVDDDEVALSFDFSTLKIDVDSTSVNINENLLTSASQTVASDVKAQKITMVSRQLSALLSKRYGEMKFLDDVKVKDGALLKFEVGHKDYALARIGSRVTAKK